MLNLNLGSLGQLQVQFQHRQAPSLHKMDNPTTSSLKTVYGLPYDLRGVTDCIIVYNNIDGDSVATGRAFCSMQDNFNKAKGRRISLTRALEQLGVSKEIRAIVWTEYLKIKENRR